MSFCENPDVLSVVKIVESVLLIARIAVPLIMILFGMLSYMSATASGDIKKANHKNILRAIAGVIALLMPTLLNIIITIGLPGLSFQDCLDNANSGSIDSYRVKYTEELIAILENDYSEANYDSALTSAYRIEDESIKNQKISELSKYEEYVEIEKRITGQKNFFNKEEFKQVYKDAMSVTNESAKEYLHQKLLSVYPDLLLVDKGTYSGTGNGFTYNVYIPELATKNMPIVTFLHGTGGSGSTLYEAAEQLYGGYFPMIIIGPQLKSDSWINVQDSLMSTIDEVCKKYECNEDKKSLMGHSLGAVGVWSLINSNPKVFSKAIAISGSISNPTYSNFAYTKFLMICGKQEKRKDENGNEYYPAPGWQAKVKEIQKQAGSDAKFVVLDTDHDGALFESLTKDNIEWLIE